MAEVEIRVGGRSYRVGCDDGQEAHLEALAARLDAEARRLSAGGAHIPESRLLLMTALMVADRLDEAEAELRAAAEAPQPAAASEPVGRLDAGELFSRQEGDDAVAAINRAVVRLKAVQAARSPIAAPATEAPAQEVETSATDESAEAEETGAPEPDADDAKDGKAMSREEMRAHRRARRARMAAGGGD